MPGQPIDVLGQVIPHVGAVGVGSIVNVPFTVTALGALSGGVPVLTLVSKYPNPAGSYITVTTIYSTQVMIDK